MSPLPTGTVTFLFTDIEGSTRLVQHLGDARAEQVFTDHRRLLRDAVESAGGYIYQDQGESFLFVFQRAKDAVLATVAAQRAFVKHAWPQAGALRVRMGLHSGEPAASGDEYVGLDVHRAARISQAGHGGQILLSLTTRELVVEELPDGVSLRDLGEHRLKDLARPQRLFQVVIPDLRADFPPIKSLDVLPNNLPRQLTSFIGREREIEEIRRLLSSTVLLTLTGGGGSGKTRLAVQVAADLVEEFPDGVWLVELAALAAPSLVPQAVRSSLGVHEQPGRPLMETLLDHLAPKKLLLVLDNCEHLLSACAQLADLLLRGCAGLKILATSREDLGISAETLYPVPSLSVPDPRRLPTVEELAQYEAVRLFTERAQAVQPTFRINEHNAQAVAQICRRLDGIPLAIELASARVKVLAVEQIATRLDDRFRLLTGGSRTALPRHQTLRAAMDWSYDLLSEPERMLLRRMSVFAGGFTLEAVEAICAGEGLEETDILDQLANLVDKSLVLMEAQGEGLRYRMLETVRQYGADRLLESGEAADVHRRHRDWYLGLAERAEPEMHRPDQAAWLDQLEREHDNLRAALEGSKTEEGRVAGLRLVAALWRFWQVRGHLSEGRRWMEGALEMSGDAPRTLRAKALNGAGILALDQGDYAAARALVEESLAVGRDLGDKRSIVLSIHNLGAVAREQGDYAAARSLLEESLAVGRDLGDKRNIALSLNSLGSVAREHADYAAARALFEESLAIKRELGDKRSMAITLNNLANVACEQGDYALARALHEESLAIKRELGDRVGIAISLHNLGNVAAAEGNHAQARSLHGESLMIGRELGDRLGIASCLEGLVEVAGAYQDPERAARLFGAAEALREAIGAPLTPVARADHARNVAATRARLGDEVFAAAWAEGRAMPLEEAIEYALKEGT